MARQMQPPPMQRVSPGMYRGAGGQLVRSQNGQMPQQRPQMPQPAPMQRPPAPPQMPAPQQQQFQQFQPPAPPQMFQGAQNMSKWGGIDPGFYRQPMQQQPIWSQGAAPMGAEQFNQGFGVTPEMSPQQFQRPFTPLPRLQAPANPQGLLSQPPSIGDLVRG